MTDPNKAEGAAGAARSPDLTPEEMNAAREVMQEVFSITVASGHDSGRGWPEEAHLHPIVNFGRAAEARRDAAWRKALRRYEWLPDSNGNLCCPECFGHAFHEPACALRALLGSVATAAIAAPSSSPAVQQEGLGPPSAGSLCDVCGLEKRPWSDGMDLSCSPANRAACWQRGYEREKIRADGLAMEAAASRACITFDPPSDPAQVIARLRLIVENHNKQCGEFVTQRNSAWRRAIELGKAKKAAEIRADAATKALMDYAEGNATPKEAPPSLNKESPSDPTLTNPVAAEAVQGKQEGAAAQAVEHRGARCDNCDSTDTILKWQCPTCLNEWDASRQPPAGPPSSSLTSQSGDPEER